MLDKFFEESIEEVEEQETEIVPERKRRLKHQTVCACLEPPNVKLPKNKSKVDPLLDFIKRDTKEDSKKAKILDRDNKKG